MFSSKFNFVFTAIFLFALVAGCGSGEPVDGADQHVSTVEQIDLPDDVQIIGLGEATHGNIEFQELKKDVFEALIENDNVRVFVLEGDFGGGQQINQFILNGEGTAEEAVNALDYSIYKTEQMIDFIQWMHDYNAAVGADEKLYFYGNDMQRYDDNKKGLLDYYEVVHADQAKKYAQQLEHVSNDTMRDLSREQLEELEQLLNEIEGDLQSNEDVYIEQSSADTFALAAQFVQIMKQRTQLFLNEGDYAQLRDKFLADNLQWIVEFEAAHGQEKVFFSGHNGHIDKTSASPAGYKSMGDYLDELYGSQYFAIGTDFINSEFQALNRGSGEREVHTIENHNDLVAAFSEVEPNIFYVGFEEASESEELANILQSEQKMVNIGDDFRSWHKFLKMFYTIEMIPNEAYDGLVIIKQATPTTVIE